MIEEVLAQAEGKMQKTVEAVRGDLAGIRTGRASPAIVDHLKVDYYGAATSLNQLASISIPEPRLLVIQPWDRRALPSIEKAILKSDLGLTPTNDGATIRLAFPQLSEERRRELVRLVKKKVEEGRVALRNVRREALEELREGMKKKELSEDDEKRAVEQLQRLTNFFIEELEGVGQEKEAELLEV